MTWRSYAGATLALVAVSAVLEAAAATDPTTKYYNQSLNHFDDSDKRRWPQRYLINDDHWTGSNALKNGCKGPILLYTGNEGAITGFWGSNGFMIDRLAPKFGALLLFPEERYYGDSMPFGDESFTADNLKYLSTEQVLADYAELVEHLQSTVPGAEGCPVVAFGGSFGGTLTTFMRLTYPHLVIGGLASSAPIGYYDPADWEAHGVNQYTWIDIVVKDWTDAAPECMPTILKAIDQIRAAPTDKLLKVRFERCVDLGF